MAYTKTNWTDRVVEKPLTYTLQTNADGTTTLIPAEGTIVTAGTPLTATSLNNLETQYDEMLSIFNASPTWTNLPLSGAVGYTGRTPRYTKVGGRVTIEGEINNAPVGTTIGTLPSGYRPPTTRVFKVAHNSGVSNDGVTVYVNPDGTVMIQAVANSTNSISLMGISFYIN